VNQTLNLSFTENWFLDQRITLGGQLGFTHAVNSKIDQDLLGPTYTSKEIPDPYVDGKYVFNVSGTQYPAGTGATYQAGDVFPILFPSAALIAQYNLVTEYQYDLSHGTVKKNAQMQYESWQFTAGVNTGYSWYTAWGRFGVGTGEKSTLQMVTYDSTIYRPANESLRENLNLWRLSNQWWVKGTWDTRDLVYNPSNGSFVSETVTFNGGFLGGNTHYTRSDTRLENYWKFFTWPVADAYNLDLVFKLRTAVSVMGPSLGGPSAMVVQPTDEIYIDGMLSGRGWGYETGGKASWTSGAEIRTPVPFVGQLLWIDTFLDHAYLVDATSTDTFSFTPPLSSQKFSWGTGIRIVSPQFPLALYVAKPFTLGDGGKVTWAKGDGIFGDQIDMKLVVAFAMEY
jgi:outer membrane protein insertion porin family